MTPSRLAGSLLAVLAALTVAGCASMNTGSFVMRGVDFSAYRTYNWGPAETMATGDPRLDNNRFFHERVQEDVEKHLAIRGFEKRTAGTPDLVLHYHASIDQEIDTSGMDQQYGCDDCRPFVYDAGTLTLDLVDTRTNKLIWRGWAERSIGGAIDKQEWMERQVDEAVTRILEKLPRRL